mmetsp:Transcript_25263/g.40513  ORF Transcript_25263/g.40513 Transcript_25263/m.40513 type:complete len:182 (+) Transcript_25263:253-798(+)
MSDNTAQHASGFVAAMAQSAPHTEGYLATYSRRPELGPIEVETIRMVCMVSMATCNAVGASSNHDLLSCKIIANCITRITRVASACVAKIEYTQAGDYRKTRQALPTSINGAEKLANECPSERQTRGAHKLVSIANIERRDGYLEEMCSGGQSFRRPLHLCSHSAAVQVGLRSLAPRGALI